MSNINNINIDLSDERRLDILNKRMEYSKYKAKRTSADLYRTVLKSKLMKEALANGVTSVQAQEREAYASPEYEEVIDAIEFATQKETELYWELRLYDIETQLWRSIQANNRNEF